MLRLLLTLAALSLPMLLSACASNPARDDYPSLAIRDAERVTGTAQPVPADGKPDLAPVSASLDSRIAQALARASKAHSAFLAASPGASQLIATARGARSPADTWIAAQVALADLQSLRSDAVIAQADLDLLYADERAADPARITPAAHALSEAREAIDTMVAEQNRTIAGLAAQLGR